MGIGELLRLVMAVRMSAYDAFISYSHALDGKLAPALQYGLERFAKPWYRARSLRVFRDATNLAASPGLWSSIEEALASARWFVLMASSVAATSSWVDREVRWWLANRSVDRLLVVVTDGQLVWDAQAGDVDWSATTALPPSLRGAFPEAPRWVDLRGLHTAEHVDQANPVLRAVVADVAAAVREVPKDQLVGEHLLQHRRTMRLARGAITALAALLALAVTGAVVAVSQRDQARNQARIATARQLAATALSDLNTHLDLAQLLAVEAYRMDPTPRTRSALFQAVSASPHLVRYLPADALVTQVTASADNTVVAGTTDGHVLCWNLATGTRTTLRIGSAPITSIATDAHGTRVLAADGATAVLWNTATGRSVTVHSGHSALVAVSPSGRRLAVLDRSAEVSIPAGGRNGLTVYDGDSGRRLGRTMLTLLWSKLGLGDTTVMLIGGEGHWERRSVSDLSVAASSTDDLQPAGAGTVGYSADGGYYGYDVFGQASAWHLAASAGRSNPNKPDLQTTTTGAQRAEAFTISADGTQVATAAAGTVYVAATNDPGTGRVQLTGNDSVNAGALAFVGNERLVSASGDSLVLWDLGSPGRFGADLGVRLDYGCRACEPRLAPSPDGRRVAFTTVTSATEYRLDGPADPQVLAGPAGPVNDQSFPGEQTVSVWSTDSHRLALLGPSTHSGLVWDPSHPARVIEAWPSAAPATLPVTARLSADGIQVAEVDSHGDVIVRRFSGGAVARVFSGTADLDTLGFPPPSAAATISYDLSTAALVDRQAVTLVDIRTGTRRALPGGAGKGMLFTRDRLLVVRPSGALEVWDITGTRLLYSIPGARDDEPVLAATPQSRLVARLRSDNVVVLTQLDSRVALGSFPLPKPPTGQTSGQTVMAFTPDGTQLLVGTAGGRLTRWDMTDSGWLHAACTGAGRDLTAAEWLEYVGTAPPADLRCNR
jgi:WD40 repeat protein